MKSQLLSVLLLCVLCRQVVRTEDDAPVNAVRLCGRELLRAVVNTCGGSRWRKHPGEDVDGGLDHNGLISWRDGPRPRRRQTELSKALAAMCCQLGCHKSDLTVMC
ncbi:hypothetical protein DPEC_G00055790 [Dallia pectoralis]|uniref:Uncharacterized protein n=1 Tax=Dallia pectoralis TaxID=75939 RepID=A0ACC2H5M0_DALPE|nr:hypothetical protein DPEC_G00055790 [Dallia pectoralis]